MVRSDARENRARILDAARAAFAEDDRTSMNQVAQRAGVGPGTLYRNFPTREALVLAVYEHEVELLVDSVSGLLEEESPVDALRTWTLDLVEAMRRKHGLGDALTPDAHRSITEQTYAPVLRVITELFDAGKRAGALRADAEPRDLLQLTAALWRAPVEPEDRAPHMLEVILDGLSARRR